ncbi:CA1P1 [Auxenochlorella protothecoides x Auxenochlorella symbiontica]
MEASRATPTPTATLRFTLLRHGQSTWNAQGRLQGSTDAACLTPKGVEQAKDAAARLRDTHFHAMVHSPLRRAADTAAIVWGERAGPKHALHDLRELDLHSWEGALKTEAAARDPGAYAAWKDRPAAFQLDGRRPVCDLWRRARSVWRALLDPGGALRGSLGPAQGAPSVLLVAHQGMNKALISTALGLEEDAFRSLPQANSAYTCLDIGLGQQPGIHSVTVVCLNQGPIHNILAGISTTTSGLLVLLARAADADEQERTAAAVAQALGLEGPSWQTPQASEDAADLPGSILSLAATDDGPTLVCLDAGGVEALLHACLGTRPEAVRWARQPGTLTVLQFEAKGDAMRPVVHCANCVLQG